MMEEIFTMMNLSARAYHKIIKVARTIAELSSISYIFCTLPAAARSLYFVSLATQYIVSS